ncbi:MAG TPA: hypothetical protein DD671_03525 [Balneolaceae bacterium]|nr:hypothetical protein [Balneolaceae bacterium]
MDLQKDFIPKERFQKMMVFILCLFPIIFIWMGVGELNEFNATFQADDIEAGEVATYSLDPLHLTKINLDGTVYTYVSVTDLSYRPANARASDILSSAPDYTKMLGLLSHPSFLVKASHLDFWKTQFHLQIALQFLGWLLFIGFLIGISVTNFKQQQKLFTREVYRWVLGLYFLIFAGFIAYPILYGRMIHFLNAEYNLGEPLTSGIAPEPLIGLGILFFVIVFLQRAIPMQNEQDLTV